MKDLRLDSTSHDLVVLDYDLSIAEGLDQVTQNIKIRLLFVYNEWFLDANKGVPFYERIGIKDPDIAVVDSIIKSTIVETPGVTQLISYESTYSAQDRSFGATFKCETEYGESILQTIALG